MAVFMMAQLNIHLYHFNSGVTKLCSTELKKGACLGGGVGDGEEEKQETSRGRSGPPSLTRTIIS